MNNKWIEMNDFNKEECSALLDRDDLIQINIEGANIKSREIFMDLIGQALQFPSECKGKFSRFEDMIRDLLWLPSEQGVCIRITNYQEFLKNDQKSKRIFEEIFQEEVFPFWETEVIKNIKGGKPRAFYVIIS